MDCVVSFQTVQPGDVLFLWVEAAFAGRINALYAHWCTTLQELQQQGDRSCKIMFVNQQPDGFLIYKTASTTARVWSQQRL